MTNNIVGGKRRSKGKNKMEKSKVSKGKKRSTHKKKSRHRSKKCNNSIFDCQETFSLGRNDINNLLPLMYLLN